MDRDKKIMELFLDICVTYEFLIVEHETGTATEKEKCNLKFLAEILQRDIKKDVETYKTNKDKSIVFGWKLIADNLKYN